MARKAPKPYPSPSAHPDHVRATQERRRSNATTPIPGKRHEPTVAEELALAREPHDPEFQPSYGVRFVCSCGTVSGYYTSLHAAREAHDIHLDPSLAPEPTPGTEVLD